MANKSYKKSPKGLQLCRKNYLKNENLKNLLSGLHEKKFQLIINKISNIYQEINAKPSKYFQRLKEIKTPYNFITEHKIKKRSSRSKIKLSDIEKLMSNNNSLLFSKYSNAHNVLDLAKKKYYKYSIEYSIILPNKKQMLYNLYIYSKKVPNDTIIYSLADKAMKRILFTNYLFGRNTVPTKIDIYLTDVRKILDDSNYPDVISADSINSAITDRENIVIYRKEECLKCLLHELIHYHEIDKQLHNFSLENARANKIIEKLKNTHRIDLDYKHRLAEAYTECMANLLNIIIFATATSKDQTMMLDKTTRYLDYEITFSFYQISKILKYFKFSIYDEFLNLKKSEIFSLEGGPNKVIKQSTDVFCYHILKTYLSLNIFQLLDRILNLDEFDVCNYVDVSIDSILDRENIKSKILIDGVNKYMKSRYHKSKKKNLRMTCLYA